MKQNTKTTKEIPATVNNLQTDKGKEIKHTLSNKDYITLNSNFNSVHNYKVTEIKIKVRMDTRIQSI